MGYHPDRAWPFTARDAELEVLLDAIRLGMTEPARPSGAVVVAAAGVGKTRLADEAAEWARDAGAPVLRAIGTRAARRVPYAALARLSPAVVPAEHDSAASLFRAVAATLPRAPHRPVLVMDDAHLLDDGSAALILDLALAGSVTVIATVRRNADVPDPITVLWKDGYAARIDLQPFSARELEAVIDAALGGVTAGTAHRLAAMADGNVLYARELVRSAVAAEALRFTDGVWNWDGTVVLADRLVDAVGRRLRGLGADDRAALTRLAIGEPLSLTLASRVVGADALQRLEAAGLVRVGGDGCRLEHPLFGEVLWAEAGTLARRAALRDLADATELIPDPGDEDVLRRVSWRLDAGEPVPPAELLRAARLALEAFDPARAEALATEALDASAPAVEARVLLGIALNKQSRFTEAAAQLVDAERAVLAHPDAVLRRLWLDAVVVALHQGLGRADAIERILGRVEDAASHRPGDRRLAAALRGNLLVDEGRLGRAVTLTRAVLDEPVPPDYAAVLAASSLGEAQAYLGLTESARHTHGVLRTLQAAGVPEARRAGDYAVLQEVMCRLIEGRADGAAEIAEGMYRQLVAGHEHTTVGLAALVLGQARILQGRAADARRSLREAVDCLRRTDLDGALPWALSMLAQSEALVGDLEAARAAREESRALHRDPMPARSRFDAVMADVRIRAALGDRTGAARTALAAVDGDDADGGGLGEFAVYRARLLHLAARLGEHPAPLASRLRALAADVECDLVPLMADHVAALADGDGRELNAVAERFAERGLRMAAADAAAAASTLAASAWGASTPGMSTLSRREREVAVLAADGLTNAKIAERLVLSVRTVESHLYLAFAKLGVKRRDELAEVFGRDENQ